MRVTPATEIPLADLSSLDVFEGLNKEQLAWLQHHGERIEVDAGQLIMRAGDPADHMYVLITGILQWKFAVGGQTSVFSESKPGSVGGALPYSRAVEQGGDMRAISNTVGYRIHKNEFREMLHLIPVLGQRLVSIMSDRVRGSTKLIDHREKMSALGKLAAGLAHELNNPASALKRSSSELLDRMRKLQTIAPELMGRNIKPENIARAVAFRDKFMQREPEDKLTSLQRGELEDEVSDWLEERGIGESWVLAEQLVSMGVKGDDLDEFENGLGVEPELLVTALQWIEGSAAAYRMVQEILSSAERISGLVQSIKVHAHLDRNPDKQPVDIRDGIESTLAILGHKLRKKSVKVVRNFADDMPKVPAYPGELNQIWTNLIDNAIDAMDEGGTLTVNIAVEGECVCARICDDGHGIPEDIQQRIFEPFFTTKGLGDGTGLGLDIVHRIVTVQHGGDIELESEPGKTCFTVWFPLTPSTRPPAN
ncbi:MAG: cyclic nucleotide-binding domain-containing protein [Planctomycetes bacterium]|nr:cyclic nucleotide-binding domain-containing protein [Planctomycetota bacterium]